MLKLYSFNKGEITYYIDLLYDDNQELEKLKYFIMLWEV